MNIVVTSIHKLLCDMFWPTLNAFWKLVPLHKFLLPALSSTIYSSPANFSYYPTQLWFTLITWTDFIFGYFHPADMASNFSKLSMNKPPTIKGVICKQAVPTLHQKTDICNWLQKGKRHAALIREYNVGSSTIWDIKAQKEQLFNG